MTGEEGKCGGGTGAGGDAGVGNTNLTDNVNNVNANVHANVNANINVSQQNGGPEKAPVVGGTNVETLPRAGKQVRDPLWIFFLFFFRFPYLNLSSSPFLM